MTSTAWRSPLSILMGARRNDDSDLELRQDFLRPTPPSTPAAAERRSTKSNQPSSAGRIAAYIPFSYFGLNSPAPAHQSSIDIEDNPSAHPPLGAFPPPITPSSAGDRSNNVIDDHDNVNQQYTSSHPWYNKLALSNSNDENDPDENDQPEQNEDDMDDTKDTNWYRQKAIIGTTFNFTNSIIGAGAMGLGGAFAASGGLISIICLVSFAYLMKLSLDLIVDLSSSPDIIEKARSGNISDDNSDTSSYYESPKFNEFNGVKEEKTESKNGDDCNEKIISPMATISQEQIRQNDQMIIDDKPSPQEESDSSPLMAQEKDVESNNEHDAPASNGHPLLLAHERERYDSLVTDLTQPTPFSPPLHMSISTDNNTSQHDPLARNTGGNMDVDSTFIPPCTYEELGRTAYGSTGRLAVLISKSMYSFGCLIAYVVVVRDNFGPALRPIINSDNGNWLNDDNFLAFWVSALIMLPLSCPRTMKPLAKFSFVSVLSIVFLVLVVIYLYFSCVNPRPSEDTSFYTNWIEIRSLMGFIESLGTFVFTFVCHHTVNLAYESLPQSIQTPQTWRKVSTYSIVLALESSLAIGIFAYLTFGSETPADVLIGYPSNLTLANIARLLLCLTMILTFPLPFLTCREMMVLILVDAHEFYYTNRLQRYNPCRPLLGGFKILRRKLWTCIFKRNGSREKRQQDPNNIIEEPLTRSTSWWKWKLGRAKAVNDDNIEDEWWDGVNEATQALLSGQERRDAIVSSVGGENGRQLNPSPLSSPSASTSGELSSESTSMPVVIVPTPSWILPNSNGRQLVILYHASITYFLWILVTVCAIRAPSLGDVLDLVGAFTGTLLAFVLPALFSLKLRGHSRQSMLILVVGGCVGLLGTTTSFIKFIKDSAT